LNTNLKSLLKDEINSKLLNLCGANTELFLVGGYIRDFLLERECFDKDYSVKGESAIEFAKKTADALGGYFVLLDEEHDIARVVLEDKINTLDFAGCVGQDIYTDLKNRDYTINAIACKIESDKAELIDPLSGINDLDNKIIRTVAGENLIDDPLRILRAYRHAAQLGFSIENTTTELLEKHKSLLVTVAIERITQELVKLFESDFAGENLKLMKESGLLEEIFPELTPQFKIPPNLHHHLCLIDHSLETIKQLENQIKSFPDWAIQHLEREMAFGIKSLSLLKLAALLHDLGKPSTWNIDEEGRHRFIKHEEVGSDMVFAVLRRLKYSKNSMKYVSKLIKYHMYPSQLIHEGIENLSEKAIMRMFRKIGEETPELILLAMADRLSARGPEITEETVNKNIGGLFFLLEKYKQAREEVKTLPKLINGKEVMNLLNIPASPIVGKILKELNEAQISGDINSEEEAINFVKNYKI
jgi:putative nucleotidyltransferase with HDIG domain